MIDIVLWTLNSGRTLESCLASVEKAVPSPHCKIAVDGGSSDETLEILEKYGWAVYPSKPGIARQANLALSKVDTDFYGSIEHDILLTPIWLQRMLQQMTNPRVAVAQGIRLRIGSTILRNCDEYHYRHGNFIPWSFSMDNNVLRTEAIRNVGGYPYGDALSVDMLLREALLNEGYRWIIDFDTVSWHVRRSYWLELSHMLKQRMLTQYVWKDSRRISPSHRWRLLLTTPVMATIMAREQHSPATFPGFVMLRYFDEATAWLFRSKQHAVKWNSTFPQWASEDSRGIES